LEDPQAVADFVRAFYDSASFSQRGGV